MNRNLLVYHLAMRVFRATINLIFDVEVQNTAIILPEGPFILVMNHVHRIDMIIVLTRINRHIVPIIAHDVITEKPFLSRLVRVLARVIDPVFIDRRGNLTILSTRTILKLLINERVPVAFAPEGTRNKEEKLQAIKDGAAYFALKSNVNIVPAISIGYHSKALRKKIKVAFGTPIVLQHNASMSFRDNVKSGSEIIEKELRKLIDIHK